MKTSKRQRKFVNEMRGMGDVPWPARAFKYPPTLAGADSDRRVLLGTCKRPVGEQTVRKGRLKRKQTEQVLCGGRVYLKRREAGRPGPHRVFCESCRQRKQVRKMVTRMLQRQARLTPREQLREERQGVKRLQKFMRRGVR